MPPFKQLSFTLAATALVFVAAGCSSARTHIFERDNGTFFVISSSTDAAKARSAAIHAAESYCRKIGKRFLSKNDSAGANDRLPATVMTHDKEDGAIVKTPDEEASAAAESADAGSYQSVSKVTVDFRCI